MSTITTTINLGLDTITTTGDRSTDAEIVPTDAEIVPTDAEIVPTIDELKTLEHISGCIPFTAWFIIICEMCEGFAEYGTFEIMQNYIQFPTPKSDSKQPGALDRGQQTATTMTTLYYLFYNLTPIIAAIIADQFWGKYKTIVVSCCICLIGLIILVATSIPISINTGVALPGLISAMVILGVGIGGIKSTAGPFMAEQLTKTTPVLKEIKGKKKIIDPETTVETLFNRLYWAVYIGAFTSTLITTSVAKYHSYWLAYLIPLIVFPGAIIMLFIGRRRYVQIPPTGSLIIRAFRVIVTAIRNRWKLGKQPNNKHLLDYAKRVILPIGTEAAAIQNENQFIDDLKQLIRACQVFVSLSIYWLCYSQLYGNLKSQAAQMNVGSLPNDVLGNIVAIVIIIFAPFFDKVIYPTLRQCNINLNSIQRITCGFVFMSLAMAWTAIVQHLIYSTEPNFNYETRPCSTCQTFNNLTVAWQVPTYVLIGISEILASITGLQYAFTNAPSTMKSIVMSLFLCTTAIGSALSLALVPVSIDPKLLWMYASLAVVASITGLIFYIVFRKEEEQLLPKCQLSDKRSSLCIEGYW